MSNAEITFPNVTVELPGDRDYDVIATVREAILNEVGEREALAWTMAAVLCSSHEQLVRFARMSVNVI